MARASAAGHRLFAVFRALPKKFLNFIVHIFVCVCVCVCVCVWPRRGGTELGLRGVWRPSWLSPPGWAWAAFGLSGWWWAGVVGGGSVGSGGGRFSGGWVGGRCLVGVGGWGVGGVGGEGRAGTVPFWLELLLSLFSRRRPFAPPVAVCFWCWCLCFVWVGGLFGGVAGVVGVGVLGAGAVLFFSLFVFRVFKPLCFSFLLRSVRRYFFVEISSKSTPMSFFIGNFGFVIKFKCWQMSALLPKVLAPAVGA